MSYGSSCRYCLRLWPGLVHQLYLQRLRMRVAWVLAVRYLCNQPRSRRGLMIFALTRQVAFR